MTDSLGVTFASVFFITSLALLSLCFYQLLLERKLQTSDGSLKYLFRRVATVSVLLLVIDRCFSLAMFVDGSISPGVSRTRIFFQAGIFVGIFVALEIYTHHSVTALCKVSMQDVPPLYDTILVYAVSSTYISFLVFTLIGIGLNRIYPIYIYFYILVSILLILNITSVLVINKISRIFVQSAKDANLDAIAQRRNKKLFMRTKIFLLVWCLLWFVATLLLVMRAEALFADLKKPINYGNAKLSFGSALSYFLMIAPWIGSVWYAWIPRKKTTPTDTDDAQKLSSEEKPTSAGSSGSNNAIQVEV